MRTSKSVFPLALVTTAVVGSLMVRRHSLSFSENQEHRVRRAARYVPVRTVAGESLKTFFQDLPPDPKLSEMLKSPRRARPACGAKRSHWSPLLDAFRPITVYARECPVGGECIGYYQGIGKQACYSGGCSGEYTYEIEHGSDWPNQGTRPVPGGCPFQGSGQDFCVCNVATCWH